MLTTSHKSMSYVVILFENTEKTVANKNNSSNNSHLNKLAFRDETTLLGNRYKEQNLYFINYLNNI